VYQKAFREGQHEFWDGVVKLRFVKGDTECMALKASIDRILKVDSAKRNDFKAVATKNSKNGCEMVRYVVARHHFTIKHIQKYLSSTEDGGESAYSFFQPFTLPGAKKYLYSVDDRDTLQSDEGDLFYLQVPNNPKEAVKAEFLKIKEQIEEHRMRAKQSKSKEDYRGGSGSDKANVQSGERGDHTREQEQLLQAKELENKKLTEQLEAMQSQLTFLHDMVQKLQETHLDNRSVRSGRSTTQRQQRGGGNYRSSTHSRSKRTVSSRSGRSIPGEIELGDDEEGSQWNENDWSEHLDENTEADDTTVATFRVSYRAQRRNSNSSAMSGRSRATSIVSTSKSIKSLPREIELDDDEDDSESHESLEEEAFDNRSMASSWRLQDEEEDSQVEDDAEKYGYGGPNAMGGGSQRGSIGPNSKKPSRRSSPGSNDRPKRRSSLASHLSKGDKSVSWDPAKGDTNTDVSSLTAGTYQVQALVVTDPYGEQGTYTGSISNSTNMPHGYGRLEYDRAGRWYEGTHILSAH